MLKQVKFTDRAEIGTRKLTPLLRTKLDTLIDGMMAETPASFQVRKFPGRKNTYIARLSADDRVILSISDSEIVITDITNHAHLSRFLQ